MGWCDFVVRYDPAVDKDGDVTRRIFYSLFVNRVKHNKPCIIFLSGKSGEGKSFTALRLQEILGELQGWDASEYVDAINIIVPMQYPKKLDAILYDKSLTKVNIICMQEARELIKAKLWHSFITQAIADINAMSRSVKRTITIVISQDITDITREMRKTITYYCEIRRPMGKPARMTIYTTWLNKQDLERPKLCYRKIFGYLVHPNGRYESHCPDYFIMSKPKKETIAVFEKLDVAAKSAIIKTKLAKLMEEMHKEAGEESHKVDAMVEYYIRDPSNIAVIGKRYRNRWKMHPQAAKAHDLSPEEQKQFEEKFFDSLKKKGFLDKAAELGEDDFE